MFALHVPDGYLAHDVATVCAVPAALALGVAAHRADHDRLRLFGVTAALVFALQMVNFPVADGTSGHVVGAALAVVLLGPGLGVLAVALVLAVQALVFADGGLAALGLNVLAMAVAGGLCSWVVVRGRAATPWAAGAAAWSSVMVAATLVSVALAASGTAALPTVLPAMLETHALIGLGEAAITVLAVAVLHPATVPRRATAGLVLALALGVATAAAPFASAAPDGLERVATDAAFAHAGAVRSGPIAGYAFPGVADERLATALAGLAGTLLVFGAGRGLARSRGAPA